MHSCHWAQCDVVGELGVISRPEWIQYRHLVDIIGNSVEKQELRHWWKTNCYTYEDVIIHSVLYTTRRMRNIKQQHDDRQTVATIAHRQVVPLNIMFLNKTYEITAFLVVFVQLQKCLPVVMSSSWFNWCSTCFNVCVCVILSNSTTQCQRKMLIYWQVTQPVPPHLHASCTSLAKLKKCQGCRICVDPCDLLCENSVISYSGRKAWH